MKAFLIRAYDLVILILGLPFVLLFVVMGRLSIRMGAYSDLSVLVSKIPFRYGELIRYYYYKFTLEKLGTDVTFRYGSFCQYPSARIGNRVLFGYYVAIGEVEIGDDVVVGGFVNFLSGTNQHSFDDPFQPISTQKAAGRSRINIGSDVWIGSNAIIAANVGNRCVVGTGSVLIKPAENNTVSGGNPARIIKQI
ncbi:acyltransferase [Pedobacter faecalis]|uniref:acyltransferase n=1 Tax=Pedobacter faecalis TaxID=3041495 RepID=UPI00254F9BBC|nr:acyltransferase [Pedobacter sp. ELA7]